MFRDECLEYRLHREQKRRGTVCADSGQGRFFVENQTGPSQPIVVIAHPSIEPHTLEVAIRQIGGRNLSEHETQFARQLLVRLQCRQRQNTTQSSMQQSILRTVWSVLVVLSEKAVRP